jgi:hypothetical protein
MGETCAKLANPRSSISLQKFSGEILPIWANFSQILALGLSLDEIRPNKKKNRPQILGRNLTARIRCDESNLKNNQGHALRNFETNLFRMVPT